MRTETNFAANRPAPIAIIRGTNDIDSAVAHMLRHGRMRRDPSQPVLRRGISFDDALEIGKARLEDLHARRVASLVEIMLSFHQRLH